VLQERKKEDRKNRDIKKTKRRRWETLVARKEVNKQKKALEVVAIVTRGIELLQQPYETPLASLAKAVFNMQILPPFPIF
jgi:hypothetical protein